MRLNRRTRKLALLVPLVLAAVWVVATHRNRTTHFLGPSRGDAAGAGQSGGDMPVPRARSMADAFRSGQLPQPLPVPAGDLDQAAVELAKKISARDEQSTASLMTALQLSGFGIRSEKGDLLAKLTEQSQGMAFSAFSVAAMAKMYSDGWHISLEDLSLILSKTVPEFGTVPLSDILATGITKTSDGPQPLRFWGRLIVELGKQSSPSYDLSVEKVDPASVELDSIQTTLIMQRLYGDMGSLAAHDGTAPTRSSHYRNDWGQEPRLQPAVFHPNSGISLRPASEEGPQSASPCDLGEIGGDIFDANAIVKTTEWEALIDIEKQAGGSITSRINAVLGIVRFILIFANMHVNVTMDNPPLVRTFDTDNGQSRILTATVSFELANWQFLNCLRPLLHREGVDFGNLPNNGLAEGVGVAWRLTEGGPPLPGTYHNDPAGLLNAYADSIVFFDNGAGSDGATWNKETGPDGTTKIKVTGNKQRKDLTHEKRSPLMKEMAVAVDVKYKNASSAKKMLGELIDVLGPGLGISSGDIAGGLVGALLETMFRMHWNVDGVFSFPVKDWVAADAWVGTIKVTQTWIQNPPGHASNEHGLSVQTSSSWVKKLNLTVALDGSMVSEWGQAATITASSSDVRSSSVEQHWSDVCHSASNLVPYSIVRRAEGTEETTKTNYRGTAMVTPIVDPATGTIRYSVGVGLALGEDA